LQATEISKLQLIIALYVVYVILADSIHSDIIHFIFIATRLFCDEKDWHDIILLYDKYVNERVKTLETKFV